jgi:23S rRNA (cytosine1962-C5)-methyltransferase
MSLAPIRLKKGEDRRIRFGHPWIFSNEIATSISPIKSYSIGQQVVVEAHDGRLLGSAYVNPHSLIIARIFSHIPHTHLDSDFFKEKLAQALHMRSDLFAKPFYRLAFSEGDLVPGLVIDRFGSDLVVQINTAGMELHKETIASVLSDLLPATSILLRNDSQIRLQEGLNNYVHAIYGSPPDIITIEENNIVFACPLLTGQKTGWFYDHRDNRAKLNRYVRNKGVLDVFSYLGAFAVSAAVFGADQVDCIESSAVACDFILKNAELNNVANKLQVINKDAFDAMKALIHDKKKYDVIILDPPAFIKKSKDHKEGMVAYQRINELALQLLRKDGILVSCSCSMHMSCDDLTQIIQRAAFKTQHRLQLLERGYQGPDHPIHIAIPETDYLKAFFLRKID